jgi:hypothetical protein
MEGVLLGFARAYAGEHVYALGNEDVVGQGGFPREISGLVDTGGREPEQYLVDGHFGEAVPAVDNALQVATGLLLSQPSLVEIREGLAQPMAGNEPLNREAEAHGEVIYF